MPMLRRRPRASERSVRPVNAASVASVGLEIEIAHHGEKAVEKVAEKVVERADLLAVRREQRSPKVP